MADPTHRTDLVEVGLRRLLQQFQGLVPGIIEGFVRACLEEVQELEDASYDVLVLSLLENAEGAQLDQWGELVDEPRDGLADDEYRNIISARLLMNRFDTDDTLGPLEVLIRVTTLATGARRVTVREVHPAALRIYYEVVAPLSDSARSRAARLIRKVSAGVRVSWIAEAPLDYFGFDSDPDAKGFNEGRFATIVG